jgi:large subunit ribosomal protein L9e
MDMWFGTRKLIARLKTVKGHIQNMITGVTCGYHYKMRFVYNHFPINVTLNGQTVEIRNFLGQKEVFKVVCPKTVKLCRSDDVKDQLELEGNDIREVSLCAAQVQQKALCKKKDIRKFLDGIYQVSGGPMEASA